MNYIVVDFEWNQTSYGKGSENRKIPFEIIEIGAVKLNEKRKEVDRVQPDDPAKSIQEIALYYKRADRHYPGRAECQ